MSSQLTILNTKIRSLDGLFSLNDFHKASGAEEHLRPSKFMRNEQTKDLVSEIEKDQSPNLGLACKSLRGGLNSGVWACEELVLSYAMWISPKFHLIVLRAFLAMHRNEPKQLALPEPQISKSDLKTLLKIHQYANRWKEFQQAISNGGETSNNVLKQEIATLYSRYDDNDGYLFIFSPNVEQDVQQANELLMRLVKNQ
ncbi:hypothetical protein BKK47_07545 [Rodentibacter mrazii]|uniref:KilA-N domain-containing protein n=1 Tax=Rodentibacter mrazii TaxID=1908257 RepID=A0A1V3IEF6_9PAST|nr:KilA-N domain-containing protein [Rodentibacter mrazii]OOF39063.1 hypothetical protein BKK47_07545 [Rodentibacter mrazii]